MNYSGEYTPRYISTEIFEYAVIKTVYLVSEELAGNVKSCQAISLAPRHQKTTHF